MSYDPTKMTPKQILGQERPATWAEMNIETAIAEIDVFIRRNYVIAVLDAWNELLAERRQMQERIQNLEAL